MHRFNNNYFKIILKLENLQVRRVFETHISSKCFGCKRILKPYNSVGKKDNMICCRLHGKTALTLLKLEF